LIRHFGDGVCGKCHTLLSYAGLPYPEIYGGGPTTDADADESAV